MRVVIIGNGISGITAAITIRKISKDAQITVISSESDHFYSRTALMYLYMGHMAYQHLKPYEDWFWEENQINLKRGLVRTVNFNQKTVFLDTGHGIAYDKLLLATGSLPKFPDLPGQDLPGVQGLYNLQDLQKMEDSTKNVERAVVVGGGLIGIELVEMLHSRCIPVTFLVREKNYWANVLPEEEGTLIANHIRQHGIDLHLNTRVTGFQADESGRLAAVITGSGGNISCGFAGIAIGVQPNIDFLRLTTLTLNKGIVVNQYLETNLEDVFAAGDCAELCLRGDGPGRLEQIWYTGRMQGETAAYAICGFKKPYQVGNWFNSAKFFDIEYQTYGHVPPRPGAGEKTLVWQHPEKNKLLRINYREATGAVVGFNLLGIRYRHEVCDRWVTGKKTINYVLAHLKEANFDPEFYRRHEGEIARAFAEQMAAASVLNNNLQPS